MENGIYIGQTYSEGNEKGQAYEYACPIPAAIGQRVRLGVRTYCCISSQKVFVMVDPYFHICLTQEFSVVKNWQLHNIAYRNLCMNILSHTKINVNRVKKIFSEKYFTHEKVEIVVGKTKRRVSCLQKKTKKEELSLVNFYTSLLA